VRGGGEGGLPEREEGEWNVGAAHCSHAHDGVCGCVDECEVSGRAWVAGRKITLFRARARAQQVTALSAKGPRRTPAGQPCFLSLRTALQAAAYANC
jgi:hypothetical protein